MGAGYTHICDKCGYKISTSGPWEFYRDSGGKRKPYGHPGPFSEEAKKIGVYGLSARVYCPKCDRAFNLVLVEFKEPVHETFDLWWSRWEPNDDSKQTSRAKCPKCGGADWILEPDEDRDIACPRCGEGKLVGDTEWIA